MADKKKDIYKSAEETIFDEPVGAYIAESFRQFGEKMQDPAYAAMMLGTSNISTKNFPSLWSKLRRRIDWKQSYDFSEPFHREKVDWLKERIQMGERPPVTLRRSDAPGKFWVSDGTHTLRAYEELGEIPELIVIPEARPNQVRATKPAPTRYKSK